MCIARTLLVQCVVAVFIETEQVFPVDTLSAGPASLE